MPRLPIDYSRTVIYRISCNDLPDFIYIGSTTDFVNRKRRHKQNSKTYEIKLYQTIRENGGWDNWRMTIIEEYSDCKNDIEKRIREQKWIDELNANLNSHKAYTTEEQKKEQMKEFNKYDKKYYEEHKEQLALNKKKYAEQNREKIAQKDKEYREQNKEEILQKAKEYREQNKEEILQKAKEYREQNKDKVNQKRREYYEQNKEQINKQKREKRQELKNQNKVE